MNFVKLASLSATAMAASLLAVPAVASTVAGVDILKEWNLVVLGDLNSASEVEGRTFVGGNLSGNSSNYYIAKDVAPSEYDLPGLMVVGDVTGHHKNLNNGSGAIVGGNVNSGFNLNGDPQTVLVGGSISNTNVNQNTVTSGLSSDPQFTSDLSQQASQIETSVNSLAYEFSTLSTNSDFSVSGNRGTFNSQPDADGVAVFNITSGDLDAIGEIQFNTNGADTVIVNVSGKNINLNDNFLGGTTGLGENVIWNFYEAETLALSTAWGGSVLAPKAYAMTSNYIEGSGVFASMAQNGEMHVGTYTGGYTRPPSSSSSSSGGSTSSGGSSSGGIQVPEPGVLLLFALGIAGVLLGRRLAKKSAA